MNIKEWIISNLKTSSIVLEAGTCEGIDTDFFSNFFIKGFVYGFEPIPELYIQACLRNNGKSNVKIYNCALGEKTGKIKIHVSDRFDEPWGSSSILAPKDHLTDHPQITFKKSIEVDCVNLDDWILDKNIQKIDLMWLDMQGYEPVMLKASMNSLKKVKYLYTEVSLTELYEGIILYPEFKQFLLNNGFEMIFEDLPWKNGGNVLFKNTKLNETR